MGKFKMPTVQEFLEKKLLYDTKKDPVWVYLEREMLANVNKKPYNAKVGAWLKFLKDLRYHYFCEERRHMRILSNEAGPPWYVELSVAQREVLDSLKFNIHQDLLEDLPTRTRKALSDLGITVKIPMKMLMKAMTESVEDAGIFIWNLYTAYYKSPPSEPRSTYSMNAMIMMSSLVFIDLDECIERLSDLVKLKKPPPPRPPKPPKKNFTPDCRYGLYLQKNYAPFYCLHPSEKKKKRKHPELAYKFRLRSEASYSVLCKDHSFLQKRKERNKKEQQQERVCNYKFWEPPSTLRNTDPKMVAYVNKLKMLKLKAKPKYKTPYKNVAYHVTGVSFSGGKPNFVVQNVTVLPTGYIPINAGIVCVGTEFVTTIHGMWKFPREVKNKCDKKCDCLAKWEKPVMEYVQESKCLCGHLYDYHLEGKAKEKYFYQATRHGPVWVDKAKVFQLDPKEDFIKETVRLAVQSKDPTPVPSQPTISASGLKLKELLAAFLADLSDSPLIIPHLPQANMLNNLQEWVRRRVNGNLAPEKHKQMKLQSLRRWLYLRHLDFKARAGRIPFTMKQLEHMDWSYRDFVQSLFISLMNDFEVRNRLKQLHQTRLWWPTMKYDPYPNKAFLDVFFTYMPGRMKDTFVVNPYSSENTPKYGAKTCPL
ncbi:uncharacterized protein LOC128674578 [Plodia interpunctella]|uniref:uncharacterized protein LOC128674578 n=1 Tax=Plodia interpunctella TaxID=58824 RepID=UPI0023689DDA|nr:uncharacterized protein LOC128674578 [Plodia interpunctella]